MLRYFADVVPSHSQQFALIFPTYFIYYIKEKVPETYMTYWKRYYVGVNNYVTNLLLKIIVKSAVYRTQSRNFLSHPTQHISPHQPTQAYFSLLDQLFFSSRKCLGFAYKLTFNFINSLSVLKIPKCCRTIYTG